MWSNSSVVGFVWSHQGTWQDLNSFFRWVASRLPGAKSLRHENLFGEHLICPKDPFVCLRKGLIVSTGWWQLKYFFNFPPEPWGHDPIWRSYFSKGLVQPPTRSTIQWPGDGIFFIKSINPSRSGRGSRWDSKRLLGPSGDFTICKSCGSIYKDSIYT